MSFNSVKTLFTNKKDKKINIKEKKLNDFQQFHKEREISKNKNKRERENNKEKENAPLVNAKKRPPKEILTR